MDDPNRTVNLLEVSRLQDTVRDLRRELRGGDVPQNVRNLVNQISEHPYCRVNYPNPATPSPSADRPSLSLSGNGSGGQQRSRQTRAPLPNFDNDDDDFVSLHPPPQQRHVNAAEVKCSLSNLALFC